MAIAVNIGSAKDRLSQLIAAAKRGEDVIIARAGVPEVRLVAVGNSENDDREARRRKLLAVRGSFKGRFDPELDWAAPTMTEVEVEAWEDDQVRRFYS